MPSTILTFLYVSMTQANWPERRLYQSGGMSSGPCDQNGACLGQSHTPGGNLRDSQKHVDAKSATSGLCETYLRGVSEKAKMNTKRQEGLAYALLKTLVRLMDLALHTK